MLIYAEGKKISSKSKKQTKNNHTRQKYHNCSNEFDKDGVNCEMSTYKQLKSN